MSNDSVNRDEALAMLYLQLIHFSPASPEQLVDEYINVKDAIRARFQRYKSGDITHLDCESED